MFQKGFAPVIMLILVLLTMTASGGYVATHPELLSQLSNQSTPEIATLLMSASPSAVIVKQIVVSSGSGQQSKGVDDNQWAYRDGDRVVFPCYLSIKIPANWHVAYNPTCIELTAPEFKIVQNPRPGIISEEVGLKLTIGWGYYPTTTKIYINDGYQDVTMSDLDSYIEGHSGQFHEISNIQDKTYGSLIGKFYSDKSITGSGNTRRVSDFARSNFIWQDKNIIYHATWADRYAAGHEQEITDTLESIQIVKR